MDSSDDIELLRQYAERHSEEAFGTLVARHVNLVYSVAFRHVRNPDHAQEITQAVFVVLARKAGSLRRGTVLSGWLFQAARLTASNFLRNELRRTRREHEAYMQSSLVDRQDDPWQQIAPLLDPAIASLAAKDRDAIVLRFVEGKNLREVGATMGSTEEAAKKRVNRAVEKLRKFFTKRGIVLSSAVLIGAISANAVQAAPAGLTASAAAAAVSGAALATSTLTLAQGTLKLMAWTKVNVAAGVCVVTLLAWQWRENTLQAREVARAQSQLNSTSQTLVAQELSLRQLDQQNQALVAERSGRAQAADQLQTRLEAAGAAATATTGLTRAGRPRGVVAKMTRDPLLRETLHQQLMNTATTRYALFVQDHKLSPEEADKLSRIWSDTGMMNLDAVSAMDSGEMTQEEASRKQTESERIMLRQIEELLGHAGAVEFTDFTANFPGRTIVDQLQQQVGEHALSEDQRTQLLKIIKAEPFDVTAGIAGDYAVEDFASGEDLARRFQRHADVNQHLLQQAAGFLAPDQLEALGMWQTNNMIKQRAAALKAVGKF